MSDQAPSNRDSATFKVVPAAATVASAPSKRVSSATTKPSLSKPPTTIHPSAVVAEKAILTGPHPITIGANAVIHPFARIVSNAGPVTIGQNVIVNEKAVVGTAGSADEVGLVEGMIKEAVLGDNVTIESSVVVEASTIGEGSTIEIGARVRSGARIGKVSHGLLYTFSNTLTHGLKYCKLSPKASVDANVVLEDYTTFSCPSNSRSDHLLKFNPTIRALKLKRQKDQVELLRRLIPSNLAKWS